MPIRPKPADWADETREEDPEVEAEAPARDVDDDPDSCVGEEISDPLAEDDE